MIKFLKNAAVVSLILNSVSAADWPQFMGPNGNNSLPAEKIAKAFPEGGPKVMWEVDVNPGYGGAAIVGDELFHIDRVDQTFDVVSCRDLQTGKEKWSWENEVPGRISHPGSRGVPTVTVESVYATSGFGHVYCLDRKTHEARWVVDVVKRFDSQPPKFGYAVHPVIKGDLCFIAPTSDKIGMAALNIKTGETVWTSEALGDSHSSPVLLTILGKEILVMPGDFDRKELVLLGVDPADGKTLFKFTDEIGSGIYNAIPSLLMLAENKGVFTGGYGKGSRLIEFAEVNGKIVATKTAQLAFGDKFQVPLFIDGRLYMTADADGRRAPKGFTTGLVSSSPRGEILWSTEKKPYLNGGSILNLGGVIVSQDGDSGELRLIQPGVKYVELAKAKVFSKRTGDQLWAPMAYSKNRLVMRSQNQLICVELK
jgi:outer membrane protein assembly factor BamB